MPYIGNPIYQSAFVVDQFSGNGSTTAFTMSVAPAGVTNVLVAVSGVLQDPSTYGVVGNTITFSAAPPSGTGNISCRYLGVPASGVTTTAYRTVTEFTATASQTTFTPPSYTVGFINVYLNGVLLGSADYTATNGTTVVLATGAAAGNLLTVESFLVSSVLNAIPNTAGSVLSSNIQTSVALTTPTMTSPTVTGTLTVTNSAGSTIVANRTSNPGSIEIQHSGTQTAQLSAVSGGGLEFYRGSSPTLAMKYDSAGRVTMPSQPSFHVRVNSAAYLNTSPVPFTNVVFDVGSNFNTSTYRFTAPIAGKYFLVLNIYLAANVNQDGFPRFNVNGTFIQYSYLYQTAGGTIHNTVAMNRIFNLSVGDYVDVGFAGSGTYYGGNAETNFYGWLIG